MIYFKIIFFQIFKIKFQEKNRWGDIFSLTKKLFSPNDFIKFAEYANLR
jgi:hypothetical protein